MSAKTDQKRRIVVHHDDLGGSHGANVAFVELWDLGIATSGAVMVPCPWFPEIAQIARERPELDLGVHLTLTSEFDAMRWRPMTGVADNGLCDDEGYFWRDVKSARKADLKAVEYELRAQIDAAYLAGIDVTHFDSHMGTVWHPEMMELYVRLGEEYRVPIAITRDMGRMGAKASQLKAAIARLEAAGAPVFETYLTTPFGRPTATATAYREIFSRGKPGLNWGAFHFTAPSDMEFFSPDIRLRTTEYDMFRDGRGRKLLAAVGYELVGLRALRDQMRAR